MPQAITEGGNRRAKGLVCWCLGSLVGPLLFGGVADAQAAFWGKYRGTVVNVADPLSLGRIQAMVPDVSGTEVTPWALPALPFAGPGHGLFLLPEVNDEVWIEFEQGDPNNPI